MKPLALYRDGERAVCAFSLYIDSRTGEPEEMERLLLDGLGRIAGRYDTAEGPVEVEVRVNIAGKFSLGAVNVRVVDETPVIRKRYSPRINVSRAYYGARRKGLLKLMRFIMRKPDVYINLAGKDAQNQRQRGIICSVIQHEFGHVLGFKDKYRMRNFKKKNEGVEDGDIMYRVGDAQRFMEYHIRRLKSCADKGRVPFRNV